MAYTTPKKKPVAKQAKGAKAPPSLGAMGGYLKATSMKKRTPLKTKC